MATKMRVVSETLGPPITESFLPEGPVEKPHSPVGASGRDRWSRCPGSVRLSRGIRSHSSPAAQEGTIAHGFGEQLLRIVMLGAKGKLKLDPGEMRSAVELYAAVVAEDWGKEMCFGPRRFLVEHGFALPQIHPDAHGTCDALAWFEAPRRLIVYDFKYGAGHEVSAIENLQMLYYAVGAVLQEGFNPLTVELVIVQPRAPSGETVKRWTIPGDRIIDEMLAIGEEIRRTQAPDAPLVSGDHCRWCPAQATCPERKNEAFRMASQDFTAVVANVGPDHGYSPSELARCLEAIPRIEAWCKAVNVFAHGEASHGRVPPGYKLVDKRAGPRKWKDESTAVATLQRYLKTGDLFDEPELKSPTQIEKEFGALPIVKALVTIPVSGDDVSLVKRESTGQTLVKTTDERKAITTRAEDEFSAVEGDLV